MKTFILSVIIGFIFLTPAAAQLGWKWGRENDSAGFVTLRTGSVAIDGSGNIYSTATVDAWPGVIFGTKSAPFDGHRTLYVVKTDSSGSCQWVKGTRNSEVSFANVKVDPVGNSYVFGYYRDSMLTIDAVTLVHPGHKHWQYFLMKLSPSGSVLWAKNIRAAAEFKLGGATCKSFIGLDNFGNAYVTGAFRDTVITSTPASTDTVISDDIFLAKFDANGGFCWEREYFGDWNDWPTAIAVAGTGDIYLSGQFPSDSINIGSITLMNSSTTPFSRRNNSFIARIDSAGNEIWARNLFRHIVVTAMVTDATGYLYACGWYDSSTTLGPFLLVNNNHPVKDEDVFTAKITATGDPLWVRTAKGGHGDAAFSLTLGICGKLWVTGCMGTGPGYSLDFEGRKLYSWSGDGPIFITAYDTSGSYFTSMSVPGGGGGSIYHYTGIVADKIGNFYLSGNYINTTMIFGGDTLNKIIGLHKLFIAKYTYDAVEAPCTTNSVEEVITAREIEIYPNPATGQCTISCGDQFSAGASAALYDLTGRLLNTYSLYSSSTDIPLAALASGMYLCRISNGTDIILKKIVVVK
ncbi:MAG: hypothetical protein K0Q79_387 [Flavipsychrobacter sp.]|jgi:hypothetical protein|nr:hypothetical protein [Flavipsychrobacter sp.]